MILLKEETGQTEQTQLMVIMKISDEVENVVFKKEVLVQIVCKKGEMEGQSKQ